MKTIRNFIKNSKGATAIEYGLICALIFLAIVGSINAFANAQNGGLAVTVEKLTTAMKAAISG